MNKNTHDLANIDINIFSQGQYKPELFLKLIMSSGPVENIYRYYDSLLQLKEKTTTECGLVVRKNIDHIVRVTKNIGKLENNLSSMRSISEEITKNMKVCLDRECIEEDKICQKESAVISDIDNEENDKIEDILEDLAINIATCQYRYSLNLIKQARSMMVKDDIHDTKLKELTSRLSSQILHEFMNIYNGKKAAIENISILMDLGWGDVAVRSFLESRTSLIEERTGEKRLYTNMKDYIYGISAIYIAGIENAFSVLCSESLKKIGNHNLIVSTFLLWVNVQMVTFTENVKMQLAGSNTYGMHVIVDCLKIVNKEFECLEDIGIDVSLLLERLFHEYLETVIVKNVKREIKKSELRFRREAFTISHYNTERHMHLVSRESGSRKSDKNSERSQAHTTYPIKTGLQKNQDTEDKPIYRLYDSLLKTSLNPKSICYIDEDKRSEGMEESGELKLSKATVTFTEFAVYHVEELHDILRTMNSDSGIGCLLFLIDSYSKNIMQTTQEDLSDAQRFLLFNDISFLSSKFMDILSSHVKTYFEMTEGEISKLKNRLEGMYRVMSDLYVEKKSTKILASVPKGNVTHSCILHILSEVNSILDVIKDLDYKNSNGYNTMVSKILEQCFTKISSDMDTKDIQFIERSCGQFITPELASRLSSMHIPKEEAKSEDIEELIMQNKSILYNLCNL